MMNRLTTLGVLLVTLLPAACTKSPSTPPSSAQSASAQSPSSAQAPPAEVHPVQAAASSWTVTTETNKLTDKKVLTATTGVAISDHPTLTYELTVKCDGTSEAEVTVGTFDRTNTAAGEHSARAISWREQSALIPNDLRRLARAVAPGGIWTQSFHYRLDSGRVETGVLRQSYTNAGQTSEVFRVKTLMVKIGKLLGRPKEEIEPLLDANHFTMTNRSETQWEMERRDMLSDQMTYWEWQEGALASVKYCVSDCPNAANRKPADEQSLAVGDAPQEVPTTRLVIADVFPGETVEFPFNNLTADQRAAMQTMCFPAPAPTAPAEPKVP